MNVLSLSILVILYSLVTSAQVLKPLVRIKLDSTVNIYKLSQNNELEKYRNPENIERLTINLSEKKESLVNNKLSIFFKVIHDGKDELYIKEGDFKLEMIDKDYYYGVDFMDPKDLAFKLDIPDQRVQSALTQNIYARALLYFPNEQAVNEIQILAQKLCGLINRIKEKAYSSNHLRSSPNSKNLLDLFSEKLLKSHVGNLYLDIKTQEYLFEVIEKVALNEEIIEIKDRVVVLSVISNLSSYFKMQAPKYRERMELVTKLIEIIKEITPNMKSLRLEDFDDIRKKNGKRVNGVEKDTERVHNRNIRYKRSGIYSLGPVADNIIESFLSNNKMSLNNINKGLVLNPEDKLKPIIWSYFNISVGKIVGSYAEALSGHMTGRPGEIYSIWDVLLGKNPLKPYYNSLEGEEETDERKRLRIALISSLYISLGYHSAVELYEGSLNYLKQSIRSKENEIESLNKLHHKNEDSTYLHYYGKATEFFVELFQNYMAIEIPIEKTKKLINEEQFLREVKDFLSKETEFTSNLEEREKLN